MRIGNIEMMKIFDFILENKSIIIGDNSLFSRNTLIMIRAIVRGKIPNDFELTQAQKQLLINIFIKSNNYFTEDTPELILENDMCIKLAIERNINSADYIQNISTDMQSFIIDKAIEHEFVLKDSSPLYLKSNYNVALNSIKLDSSSADFINWDEMNGDQLNNLVNEAIKNGYILSSKSCNYLAKSKTIVLQSIKKDMNKIEYASESIKHDPDIFKYLLLNGYPYEVGYIIRRGLNCFLDAEVIQYCFELNRVFDSNNKTYISRIVQLYYDALNTFPSIKTFESIFQMIAEEKWKENRKENINYYENIFGKICTQLRNNNDFERAINNLIFLDDMKAKLEEKYGNLYLAMKEYYNIFHSNMSNKLAKMEASQDTIAKLSALYVSKSKEDYKKEELEELYELIKPYFTLRLGHPFINKKVIQNKKKEKFKNLYQNNNEEVIKFLNDVARNYSEFVDESTIIFMISRFVNSGYSKLDEFINVPFNYNCYKRYEKAVKLIHRLNSGYIEYNGAELTNYRDIIKLDEKKQEYVYTGISFNKDDLIAYNEHRKKEKVFEKIKKDIILRVRTIEIDNNIDSNMIESLSEELPFTDEYFAFNSEYTLSEFNFKCFLNNCLSGSDSKIFLSDETFANVHNIVVNNGLIWLLLFMSKDKNQSLKFFNRVYFFELIDNMMEITELAKEFHFDLSNFTELVLVKEMAQYASAESIAILGKEVIEKLFKSKDYTDNGELEIVLIAKELVCQMTKRSKSTVPYISGQTMNYRYSTYDSQDETILLAGINTDACFKVDGNDNDFLHYCALDKNGFVIKITDVFGNFIGRGSGFRNGNCVFINQLRTIYDEGGNFYNGICENEKKDIIETFKKACEDIVSTSQKNLKETDKIDHVFVTRSYSLKNYDSNVPDVVSEKIGCNPMDNESEDWIEFVENTSNLIEAGDDNFFETDYGVYPLICMASSKRRGVLRARDIKPKNVEALYDRPRNRIIATTNPDSQVFKKINKISGVKSFFENTEFKSVEVPKYSTIFTGDNWYIIFNDGNIISSCILDFDHKAQVEFNVTKDNLIQQVLNSQQQTSDDGNKILSLHP